MVLFGIISSACIAQIEDEEVLNPLALPVVDSIKPEQQSVEDNLYLVKLPAVDSLKPETKKDTNDLSPVLIPNPDGVVVTGGAARLKDTVRDTRPVDKPTLIIATDEDNLAPGNEDRNYTMGFAFSYSSPKLIESFLFWPITKLARSSSLTECASQFSVVASAFTPENLKSSQVVQNDRPYSFLFALSTASTFAKAEGTNMNKFNTYSTFRINYALLGTNLGKEVQTYIHNSPTFIKLFNIDRDQPRGWANQISQGGYPTFLLEYNRLKPFVCWMPYWTKMKKFKRDRHSFFDASYDFGGSVGYYDKINSGLFCRAGWLLKSELSRWANSVTGSLGSVSKQKLEGISDAFMPELDNQPAKSQFEFFAYGRMNTILMLRNSLLVGQYYVPSTYTLDYSTINAGIMEFEWGIGTSVLHSNGMWNRKYSLLFRQVFRSPEFHSQYTRWHYYGTIAIMIPI